MHSTAASSVVVGGGGEKYHTPLLIQTSSSDATGLGDSAVPPSPNPPLAAHLTKTSPYIDGNDKTQASDFRISFLYIPVLT